MLQYFHLEEGCRTNPADLQMLQHKPEHEEARVFDLLEKTTQK
ncbi:MAG: hypothetical protein QXH03_02160 [Candidatus Bathyarchaeia archaeon]